MTMKMKQNLINELQIPFVATVFKSIAKFRKKE